MGVTVYLHIGSPKSGTTYLQALLSHNRRELAANGVLWPGETWQEQAFAVRDLLNANQHGYRPPEVEGAWQRLIDEVHAWEGHAVVISMEWLVAARPQQIRRAVESLAPHEVRIILTARDIARTVPAQWQESVQNWETWTWKQYLADVTSSEPLQSAAGRRLFNQHDVGRVLRTWNEVVAKDRMIVVTIPPPGSDPAVLWTRFAQAIGVDTVGYDVAGGETNSSLGAASAEVMRRVNLATRDRGLHWGSGERILKRTLAKNTLNRRSRDEPRLALPAESHDWAQQQAKRLVADIEALGVATIGDLADLIPAHPVVSAVDPAETEAEQRCEAAIEGIAGLAVHMGSELEQLRDEADTARRERDAALRDRAAASRERDEALEIVREHRELPPRERVKRTVVELESQVRSVSRVLAGYRRIRRFFSQRG